MRAFPAKIEANDGAFTVTFRDVPEAITQGDTLDDAKAHAVDVLEAALSGYIDDFKDLPVASTAKRGEHMIALSAIGMAKTALYEAMLAQGVTRSELARRLSIHLVQARRLLDLNHASKFEQLERALAVVNRRMVVTAEAA